MTVPGWSPRQGLGTKDQLYGVIHKYGFNLSFHTDVCLSATSVSKASRITRIKQLDRRKKCWIRVSCSGGFFYPVNKSFNFFEIHLQLWAEKVSMWPINLKKKLFTITAFRPCHSYGLPARKYERSSHSIKWKMSPLTSDTSPPTSCFWPSFMSGGCKNVDWLQQPCSLYPSLSQDRLQMKNKKVHAVLVGFFFRLFPWLVLKYFWPCFARMKGSSLVWSHEEEEWEGEGPWWIFQITRHPSTGYEGLWGASGTRTQLDPTGGGCWSH